VFARRQVETFTSCLFGKTWPLSLGLPPQQTQTAKTQLAVLNPSDDSASLSATGFAMLKQLAAKHPDALVISEMEVAALLTVKPLTLRDPPLAIASAEHEALLTKRKEPDILLSLAQAYRSARQLEKAGAVATEGLALLPAVTAGTPMPRIRKLLESEAATKRAPK
jgi:hypothetical protein